MNHSHTEKSKEEESTCWKSFRELLVGEKERTAAQENGLRVDALKGSFLQARPDAPVRQAAVSRVMNPFVLIEMAIARLS